MIKKKKKEQTLNVIQHVLCVLGPQQCILCGNLAQEECTDCFKDPLFSKTGFKIFCNTCSDQVLFVSSLVHLVLSVWTLRVLPVSALVLSGSTSS